MKALNVSNALLGDQAALASAWKRDGYWFFRDVLDKDAVARMRDRYMRMLDGLGVARRDDPQARYNGKSLEGFPFRGEPLVEQKAWKPFVAEPGIHDFFKRLLDDEPWWMPTPEYRATPPAQDRSRHRFDVVHQDGFYNQGIPFKVCWFPLAEIDEDVGGITLAPGMHHEKRYIHEQYPGPLFFIPPDALPADVWARADVYRPGDVLLMDIRTPHTGLANYSDRFRLSLDIRVMRASDNTPIVGTISAIDANTISIDGEDGRQASFKLDDATYCRGLDGLKIDLAEIPNRVRPGDEMVVSGEDGHAILIRPPH